MDSGGRKTQFERLSSRVSILNNGPQSPISTFFPAEESVDVYAVLSILKDSKLNEIQKTSSLKCHPDKHATASESTKSEASLKFQQVGFENAMDEGFDLAPGEDWEAHLVQMFDCVTRGKLDEMKKEYQCSSEEGGLTSLTKWESSIKDEKTKPVRQKQNEKEVKEAEKLAKELGVWDEFYGSGKAGKRKGQGKSKGKDDEEEEGEEDVSALQALILKKKQKNTNSFFDSLAVRYAEPAVKTKGKEKKRAEPVEDEELEESPKKRSKKAAPPLPDIDDADFEKLQQKLFDDKAKDSSQLGGKKGKGRKAK
ncbi:hypothetical protein EV368DRAFT_77014 [Lentinula lateritia]|nr:hypothetical protein EV368DRAFT_77014 [Lentinula lateritia]